MSDRLVLRCCRDWEIDWQMMSRDLCPVCGMRRMLVDLRNDKGGFMATRAVS